MFQKEIGPGPRNEVYQIEHQYTIKCFLFVYFLPLTLGENVEFPWLQHILVSLCEFMKSFQARFLGIGRKKDSVRVATSEIRYSFAEARGDFKHCL
jgi:hypothetical protein